jgi:hypothetical protein
VALLGLGCGGDFEPASRVVDFRVIAVRADRPYAPPGAKVHLDAIAHDPAGGPIAWGWGLCVDPPSFGVLDCIDALDPSTFTIGSAPAFDVVMPADVIDRIPKVAQAQASVGVVAVACPGELTLEPRGTVKATGDLPFACRAGGRTLATHEYVAGVKRIFARATDANANPAIAQITWDGADWPEGDIKEARGCDTGGHTYGDCGDALAHRVAVVIPESSTESGVDAFGVPFTEQVVAQFYATEGIFEHDLRIARKADTRWVARRAAAGGTVTMWFVVRDDRGGVSWAVREVRVIE